MSDPKPESAPSSPPCSAREADPAYMGYLDPPEVAAALNELLEAERAGSIVALASSREAGASQAFAQIFADLHHEEAHWCAELMAALHRIGAEPSRATGHFAPRALAIGDLGERLSFVNRGQDWVVRRVERLAPRVRDDSLAAMLREMGRRHSENIDRARAALG